MALTQQNKEALLHEAARLTFELKNDPFTLTCIGCVMHALTTINMLIGMSLEKLTVKEFMDAVVKANIPEVLEHYTDFIHKHQIEY